MQEGRRKQILQFHPPNNLKELNMIQNRVRTVMGDEKSSRSLVVYLKKMQNSVCSHWQDFLYHQKHTPLQSFNRNAIEQNFSNFVSDSSLMTILEKFYFKYLISF